MNNGNTNNDVLYCSFLGLVRGWSVHFLTQPLDVIRTVQQGGDTRRCDKIFKEIYTERGPKALYSGLSSQLMKTVVKQPIFWQFVKEMPPLLEKYHVKNPLHRQIITGVAISATDSFATFYLERRRIQSIKPDQKLMEGLGGMGAYFTRLAIHWATPLAALDYFRRIEHEKSENGRLSYWQMTSIGLKVGTIVNVVASPFDTLHILKQTKSPRLDHLKYKNLVDCIRSHPKPMKAIRECCRNGLVTLYAGSRLGFVTNIVNSVGTVYVMEILKMK